MGRLDEAASPVTEMCRLLFAFGILLPVALHASAGNPGEFLDASAGPYPLSISVKLPRASPGVAQVEIRVGAKGVTAIRLVGTPVSGPGAQIAPSQEWMQKSGNEPNFFTGPLWLMAAGPWKARVIVDGEQGQGELFVTVPAAMSKPMPMNYPLAGMLGLLGLLLWFGLAGIVGTSVREGHLKSGHSPTRANKMSARLGMLLAAIALGGVLYGANLWWTSEAEYYAGLVYQPLGFEVEINPNGNLMTSILAKDKADNANDLIPDSGHFMQLLVVSVPAMDKMWSLYPEMQVRGVFNMRLPSMDAGKYRFYGDIVHASGFPETLTAELDLKNSLRGQPLEGDDAQTSAPPAGRNPEPGMSVLGEKYRMVMVRGNKPVKTRVATHFTFRVETRAGKPAEDLELYMGVPGQAIFIKNDMTEFARVNPSGTIPMAALRLFALPGREAFADRTTHSMNMGLPAEVVFPYGIPSPGNYRIFVQVKRAGKIETGTFDIDAFE